MLVIRFQRIGRKNDPAFRIVVTEKRSKPKSGELEILGSYHPKTKETVLKQEQILYWLSKGAKTSPTVHNLLISKGVIQGKKIDVSSRKNTNQTEKQQKNQETGEVKGIETAPAETPPEVQPTIEAAAAEPSSPETKPSEGEAKVETQE